MLAVNVAPVPVTAVPANERFNVLEVPPFSVPLVKVKTPVKVCDKEVPRLSVPPAPLIVNAPPLSAPVNVAVPAVLVIETVPVVVKPEMVCEVAVPLMVIFEALAVSVPFLVKLPPSVRDLLFDALVFRLAPLFMVKGTLLPNILLPPNVISPVLAIITPPVPLNVLGHSDPVVLVLAVLYCKVAAAP